MNSKNTEETWLLVANVMQKFKVKVRLITSAYKELSEWSHWISFPSRSYVETLGLGVVKKEDVMWIELCNIEFRKRGRLVPDERINHFNEIITLLQSSKVNWKVKTEDSIIIALCP